MAVRIDPSDVQRERSHAIAEAHRVWFARQIAAGVDGPVPPGRPEVSDWNEHVPDMESSGAALDELAAMIRAALP